MSLVLNSRLCITGFFLLSVFFNIGQVLAEEHTPVKVTDESRIDLAPHLEYWRTNRTPISLERVERAYKQGKFTAQQSSPLTLPRTRDGIWMRVELSSAAQEHAQQRTLVFRKPFYDQLQVFIPTSAGYQRHDIGYDHFENGEPPKTAHNQIDITLDSDNERPIYIYAEDSLTIRIALTLWNPDALIQHDTRMTIFFTAIYTIMLVLALYNFSLFTMLRDPTYLHYVIYMIALCAFLMTRDTTIYQIPWLSWPAWGVQELIFTACLAAVCAARFNQSFVELSRYTPQLNKFIYGAMAFLLAIAATSLLNIRTLDSVVASLHNWGNFVLAPLMVAASIIALRHGSRQARFFLTGWVFLLSATFIAAISALGLIGQNAITLYGIHVSAALEAIILSVGLADRINMLKKDKALAEQNNRDSGRRIEEETKRRENADAVTHYLSTIHSQSSEEQVYLQLVATLGNVMEVRRSAMLHGNLGSIRIYSGDRKLEEYFSLAISGRIKLLERVANQGEAMLLQNSSGELSPFSIQTDNQCLAAIPLYCWRQEWAVILMSPETEHEITNFQLRQATELCNTVKEPILNYRRYRATINGDALDACGAMSRTSLLKHAQRAMREWKKHREPLSTVLLHIEDFYLSNPGDNNSAEAMILKAALESCQSHLERSDIVGRYSNNQLLLLLPGSDLHAAEKLCRKIHENLLNRLSEDYGDSFKLTIEFSVAAQRESTDTLDKLVRTSTPVVLGERRKYENTPSLS